MLRRSARNRALAWAVAGLVALAVHHEVSAARSQRSAWGRTEPVVVAVSAVDAGDTLDGRVHTVELPVVAVPAGAVERVPPARRAARSLARGEVLTGDDVAGGDRGPVAARLPAGTAGIRVAREPTTPEVGAGDRVDVVAPGDPYGGVGPATVARYALVLDADDAAVTLAVAADDAGRTAGVALGGPVALVVRP